MKYLLGLAVLVLTLGCAALTPEELVLREDRAYDRQIKKENYQQYKHSCNSAGGIVYIEGGTRLGIPVKGAEVRCISKRQLNTLFGR